MTFLLNPKDIWQYDHCEGFDFKQQTFQSYKSKGNLGDDFKYFYEEVMQSAIHPSIKKSGLLSQEWEEVKSFTFNNIKVDQNTIKILFYFTADGRVDFRQLVKDLANIFRTRIELRQIGVRDEVKMLGGYGMCGRELCCCNHLGDLNPVSIKMAKEQGLSLNPTKISGVCGRLICCLKHEQEVYEEKLSRLPSVGSIVNTPEGKGTVEDVEVLREIIKVKIEKDGNFVKKNFKNTEIEVLKVGRRREKQDEEVNMKELKALEEGFKREDI